MKEEKCTNCDLLKVKNIEAKNKIESMKLCISQINSLTIAPEEILYNEDLRKQLKEIHRLTKIELEKK